MPANLPLFEQMGVSGAVRAIGIENWGAEFVSPWHETKSQSFQFGDAWDKSMPFSYQVRRSELDEILIRNAARLGAEVIEGCRVKDGAFAADQSGALVNPLYDDGHSQCWRTRYVVDASGRETVLEKQFRIKRLYIASLLNFMRTGQAIRRRRSNIRAVSDPATAVN